MELFSYLGLHTAYLFVFSVSLGLGIGASVLSHGLFYLLPKTEKCLAMNLSYSAYRAR